MKKTTKYLPMVWRWWAKSLGQKAGKNDAEADQIAVIRTLIFTTYLVTNCFIVAGVIRHWNGKQNIIIEIYETPTYSEVLHSKGRDNLGMARDTRIEGIYHSATIKNRTGEFE
jgi:hypothetical protein